MSGKNIQELAFDLLQNHPCGLILVTSDWDVEFVNPGAMRLLGALEELSGEPCLWDMVPELASFFFRQFSSWARGKGERIITGFYPPENRWLRFTLARTDEGYILSLEDFTQDQLRFQAQQEMEVYWNRVFDSVADVIIVTDQRGNVLQVNSAIASVFGYRSEELVGQNLTLLMSGNDRTHHDSYMQHYKKTGRSAIMGISRVVRGRHKDGHMLDLDLSINAVNSEKETHYVGVMRDVSERVAQQKKIAQLNKDLERRVEERTHQLKLLNEELERMAMYDNLTGLANRAQFNDILRTVTRSDTDSGTAFSVLMLDLNGFKRINDSLGHHVGDRLLKSVADRLKACVRDGDVVARVGGDEFVILLDQTTAKGAEIVARKLCEVFDEPFDLDSRYVDCSCSVGVAVFPVHGRVGDLVLQHADLAMYHAKRNGLGFSVYSDELMEEAAAVVERLRSR